VSWAYGINDAGQIAGATLDGHAILLTPIKHPLARPWSLRLQQEPRSLWTIVKSEPRETIAWSRSNPFASIPLIRTARTNSFGSPVMIVHVRNHSSVVGSSSLPTDRRRRTEHRPSFRLKKESCRQQLSSTRKRNLRNNTKPFLERFALVEIGSRGHPGSARYSNWLGDLVLTESRCDIGEQVLPPTLFVYRRTWGQPLK